MKVYRISFAHTAVAIAIVASLTTLAGPALSQPSADAAVPTPALERWHKHGDIQARLGRMAERLHITPTQQAAWTAYTNTVKSLVGTKPAKPAPDADAASLVRFRADLAAGRAQKLSKLVDATAALQQALDPDQQKTLGQMMHHASRRTRHGGYGGR